MQPAACRSRVAYATLGSHRPHLPGVAALACSLRSSRWPLLVLVSGDSSEHAALLHQWSACGTDICIVRVVAERLPTYRTGVVGAQQHVPGRPEAVKGAQSFLKLWLWRLTTYERLVYVDPDVLLRRPLDDLFTMALAGPIAASPDDGWTVARSARHFNSGLLVLRPKLAVFESLVDAWRAQRLPSFDGGDQGFLWSFFGNASVTPLPRRYNTLKRREYAADGAAELRAADALHFVGNKPWGKRGRGCRKVYPASQAIWQAHVDGCAQLACANASMHRALLGQPSLHQPLVPGRRGCIHDAAMMEQMLRLAVR